MPTSKEAILKDIKRACKFFDLYGQNVNLLIEKKPRFHTTFSGIISMAVLMIIIYNFTGFISSWMNKEKMTVIPSGNSFSVLEILAKNQSYEYELDFKNYYIYWVVTAEFPDGTSLRTPDLKNYLNFVVNYCSTDYVCQNIVTEPCKIDYQDIFLGFDETTIKNDFGKTSKNRICIKNEFKMGLFPDTSVASIRVPAIEFYVLQCVNSTENNNSCHSQEEIDRIITYTIVQTSIPNTIFDFNNVKKPQKNTYDYHYSYLDKSLSKNYLNTLTTSILSSDYGLLSEDYRVESTNFNPNINYDPNIRKGANDPLYTFIVQNGFTFQNYYLKNLKLNEIVGNLGGLVNAIFLLGKLLCSAYNSIYLRFKIINSTFSHSNTNKMSTSVNSKASISTPRNAIASKIARHFSYFGYLFPSKEVRMFYQKGSNNLHEYLDIRKIIKRLQDIDKLKIILLNENQRNLFERIPKPEVVFLTKKPSVENKNKRKISKKILAKYLPNNLKMPEDNDPINKRILECINPTMNNNIEITNNGGNF